MNIFVDSIPRYVVLYSLIMASLVKKIIKGNRYYYAVESKRVNGKPRIVKQIYLGTVETILNKINSSEKPIEVEAKEFGTVATLWQQAQELGLIEIIDDIIPQKSHREISVGTFLTVGAINRAICPKSKDGIGRWMDKTVLPRLINEEGIAFDSQSFWDAMDRVEPEHIAAIEESLWKMTLDSYQVISDTLFYDNSNFATYIDGLTSCSLPQRGKPKKGSPKQRLVGISMAATQGWGFPMWHMLYEGNRQDAKLFPETISLLVHRFHQLTQGSKKLTLVFDKGNNSNDNIQLANSLDVYCIGSLKPSHFPQFLKIPLDKFTGEVEGCKVHRKRALVFGRGRTVVVTYYPKLYERQRRTLDRRLEKAKAELFARFQRECEKEKYIQSNEALVQQYENYLKSKKLSEYLRVKVTGKYKGRLKVELNKRAIKKAEQRFGKTIIFCDREDLSTAEIVSIYHGKNVIEDNFRYLKDRSYLRFEPLRHWTDQKIRVHALMCVLGLFLVKLLLYRLNKANLAMSLPVMMEELDDIREVMWLYPSQRLERMITKLSSVQRKLYDLFRVDRHEVASRGG
jgi:transposase